MTTRNAGGSSSSSSSSSSSAKLPSGPQPTPAAAIVGNRGERFIILKRQGPVGHFQFVERVDDGCAIFTIDTLPPQVKTLWALG